MAAQKRKEIVNRAKNIVSKAKTADELNRLIAKYIDALDNGRLTSEEMRVAEMVSGFIGRQVSVENVRLSFERLSIINNGKKYAFAS